MTQEAIHLLRRVKRMILNDPKRIRMGLWLAHRGVGHWPTGAFGWRGFPRCGTVGCVGGWVEELYRRDYPRSTKRAAAILGLDSYQAYAFFYDPTLMYDRHPQTKAHAQAVARHIDKFIAYVKGGE